MGESELMDLFPDSYGKENHKNKEEISDEGYYYGGRSKMSDYKHSNNSIHKMNDYNANIPERNPQKKSYINVSDERIVWAGAIFVFFGVFIFLIGYWLGKTTLKDILFNNKQNVQKIEDKIDQKKMENNFAFSVTPLQDNTKPDSEPLKDNKVVLPAQEENTPAVKQEIKPDNLTAPPIKAEENIKTDIKTVKVKTNPSINVKKPAKPQTQKIIKPVAVNTGNYTIQVSAHTSMEKARQVEDGLRKTGLQSYLVEANVNGIIYYRVRVGKYTSKDDAHTVLQKIKTLAYGKDSMILNLQ